jgi:hypothetical protein
VKLDTERIRAVMPESVSYADRRGTFRRSTHNPNKGVTHASAARVSSSLHVSSSISSPPSMAMQIRTLASPVSSILHRVSLDEEISIDFQAEIDYSVLLQATSPITPSDLLRNLHLCHPGPWVI